MSLLAPSSLLAIVASYLLGSLSFAVIVSKVLGMDDPRNYGSKNPGATNVLRSGRKGAALATLLLDAIKGWLPVFLILRFGGAYGLDLGTAALAGLAAFLGHLYPVFFRYSSLASLVSAAFAPFYQLLIWGPSASVLTIAVMSLLLVWRHRENIRRLLACTESKLGSKSAPKNVQGG